MMKKTHITSSLTVGLLPFALMPEKLPFIWLFSYAYGILLGSVLPDIDHSRSAISYQLRIIWLLLLPIVLVLKLFPFMRPYLKHRGVTHWAILQIPLLLLAIAAFIFLPHKEISSFLLGITIGMILHSIGDMTTIGEGIEYFFPFSKKKIALFPKFLRYKVNSIFERVIVYPFFFLTLLAVMGTIGLNYYNFIRENNEPVIELLKHGDKYDAI